MKFIINLHIINNMLNNEMNTTFINVNPNELCNPTFVIIKNKLSARIKEFKIKVIQLIFGINSMIRIVRIIII